MKQKKERKNISGYDTFYYYCCCRNLIFYWFTETFICEHSIQNIYLHPTYIFIYFVSFFSFNIHIAYLIQCGIWNECFLMLQRRQESVGKQKFNSQNDQPKYEYYSKTLPSLALFYFCAFVILILLFFFETNRSEHLLLSVINCLKSWFNYNYFKYEYDFESSF